MKVVERRRFYLLDDDNDELEIYNEIISESKLPIELHYFSKGAQMFDFLQTNPPPDIFVLDINLPGISGVECIRRLKADARYKNVPLVACSSVMYQHQVEESISAGAIRFRVKPSDFFSYRSMLEEFYSLCCKKDDYIMGKTG